MPSVQGDCSLTMAPETTWGTPVATTRAYEFVSESMQWQPKFSQGVGLRVGSRLPTANRRKLSQIDAGGDISVEAVTKGMGYLWNACLGASTSNQRGATAAYQQVHTPTTTDYLPSYTIQKGIPLLGGGVQQAHTFNGAVVSSFELSVSPGGILELKTTWWARDVSTSIAYAPPAYAAEPQEVYTFVDAALTIGGTVTQATTTALASGGTTVANIRDFDLQWDNKLDSNGYTLGAGGHRGRPPAITGAEGKGKLTAEFSNTLLRDAFLAQTPLAIVATFTTQTTALVAGTFPTLQVVIPVVKLEGELPTSNGGDVITQSIDYTVLDGLNGPGLQIVSVTGDTAL